MNALPSNPLVVFCTTCKGRTQHLKQTLPANLADNKNSKFVILNYNSKDGLSDYLLHHHYADIESGRLVMYRFTEPGPFRMAHAKNLAHRLGILEGGDILVNLDADNFAGKDFDLYAAKCFQEQDNIFLWALMLKGEMSRGISGRIAVSRSAFLLAGGYDERFATWSPDDKDFNRRLRILGLEGQKIDNQFLVSIRHSNKMRFKDYPHANLDSIVTEYNEADISSHQEVFSSSPIVNAGKIGLGVVYRNLDSKPLEITAVPTRIFGIGLHKTATTSLHSALEILGYNSVHWKNVHWAKAIWKEMRTLNYSPTLEKSYAVSDLPIPLYYRELDKSYPGSKFILTLRNETNWLDSVRNHWSNNNPYRHQWDFDLFSHRIHSQIYGQREFNEKIFLERYRRHTAEVHAYFANRKQDLLVMNMDEGAGWHELCGFLRCSLPDVPYPRCFERQ